MIFLLHREIYRFIGRPCDRFRPILKDVAILKDNIIISSESSCTRVRDRFVIYCQNNDLFPPKIMILNVKDRNSIDSHYKISTYPRSVPVRFSVLADPTFHGCVECLISQN